MKMIHIEEIVVSSNLPALLITTEYILNSLMQNLKLSCMYEKPLLISSGEGIADSHLIFN